jgi:hypothetical protein
MAYLTLVSMYQTMSLSKQPNDNPPALPKNLAESIKLSYSISLADLPKMHCTLDHPSSSQFAHILLQALNVDTLPEDLHNTADLVHDHCVICVKSSRPVPRPRFALQSVHQPGVCASMDYRDMFCRPDQCSLMNSYVDNNSSLISQ